MRWKRVGIGDFHTTRNRQIAVLIGDNGFCKAATSVPPSPPPLLFPESAILNSPLKVMRAVSRNEIASRPVPRRDSKGIKSHSPRRPRFSLGSVLQLLVAARGGRWKGRQTSIPGTMDSELPTRRSPTGRISNRWRCSTPISFFFLFFIISPVPRTFERYPRKSCWNLNKEEFFYSYTIESSKSFSILGYQNGTKTSMCIMTDRRRICDRIEDSVYWICLPNNIYTLEYIF